MRTSREPDERAETLFRVASLLAVFLAGYAVHSTKIWPYPVLRDGAEAAIDIALNVKAYAGIEPTRHIYRAPRDGNGVTVNETGKTGDGLIFMTGMFDGENAMRLIDNDGRGIARWSVSYMSIFPDSSHIQPAVRRPHNDLHTLIHGAQPLPDGSVVFNFDLHGLVRVDRCGKVLWTLNRMANHSIDLDEDGTLWVPSRLYHTDEVAALPLHQAPFFEDQLLQVSQDGEILREISLPKLLMDNNLAGLLFPGGTEQVGLTYDDFMHINDAEVLTTEKAAAFPRFAAGDIMLSMRQLNLVVVFDPQTLKVKWYQSGPWLRQHDPDFEADGTISVFDNRTDNTLRGSVLKGSAILAIDPHDREIKVAYEQTRTATDTGFYTYIMGKHQTLANGNRLISQPTYGRAFEVDGEGRLVWEYINRFDENRVGLVTEATRYPATYFDVTDWSCTQEGNSQ